MSKRVIDEDSVLHAALVEFTTKNYEEASVNAIIKNAGISKGSFYYRFENKYALYIHLLKESSKIKWEFIHSHSQSDMSMECEAPANIFEIFLLQARTGAEFAKQHPLFHKLSKMLSKEKGTQLYEDVLKELGHNDQSGLDRMIDEAVSRGDISEEYSADFVKKVIRHLFVSFDDIFFQAEDFDLEKVMENLKEFVRFMRVGFEAKKG